MKKIILALTCLLLVTKTYAQNGNSLLWEVSGKGLKSSSYVFGTYHLAGKNLVDSLPEIGKRFNTCKTVVGELIIDTTMAAKLIPYMMITDSLTLDKLFTAEEYQQIDTCIKQIMHVDAKGFNQFKPAAVATMISILAAPNTTSAINPAIDMYFQQEGKRRGDKILGLESFQQQAELLMGQPMDIQKKQLLVTVKKKDELKASALKMFALYRNQDLKGLGKMLDQAEDELGGDSDKLLKDRNLNWMTQLPTIMQEQATFIAVGAGHLIGQYGLVNQLRLKGYTVKPVKI